MQSVLTAPALDFIPEPIRKKLGLKPGTVMEFDEEAAFLKATPAKMEPEKVSDQFQDWLASSIGIAKGKLTTDERMNETRGED